MTECNVENRTIFCSDNLDILTGINSDCIDLIYLDPPFNKNRKFTAPIGTSAEGAGFADIFREDDIKKDWLIAIREYHPELSRYLEWIKGAGKPSKFAYLVYMAIRLVECHRVLKSSGSIYLHCDPIMSHYLKLAMDCVFGEGNFRNEIVWQYFMGGKSKQDFARKHDVILRYAKGDGWTFNLPRVVRRLDYKPSLGDDSKHAESGKDELGYWTMVRCPDVWQIRSVFNMSNEYVGYPTQKPVALLERIINASSNEGDMVLDPFAGSGTTCIAAERLGRQWAGIDIWDKVQSVVLDRLEREGFLYAEDLHFTSELPVRTDDGGSSRPQI